MSCTETEGSSGGPEDGNVPLLVDCLSLSAIARDKKSQGRFQYLQCSLIHVVYVLPISLLKVIHLLPIIQINYFSIIFLLEEIELLNHSMQSR